MTRRILFTLLALLLVTGAAACGGGGDDESASDDEADEQAEGSSGDDSSETTLPTAEEEAADDGDASGDEGEGGSGEADPPADGGPGSVATELGVDRTFTGEGSDELCGAMDEFQTSADPDLSETEFADQMAAITPPDEIAAEWETMHTVLKAIASDPSGEALASISQEELDEWTMANSVIAAYLGDVCGLAD
jgi:hypothetical protein